MRFSCVRPRASRLTNEGIEFLSYARQVVEQAELLEQRYMNKKPSKKLLAISTQHYAFAVQAFVGYAEGIRTRMSTNARCAKREPMKSSKTSAICEANSDIIYLSDFNRKVIAEDAEENALNFLSIPFRSRAPCVHQRLPSPRRRTSLMTSKSWMSSRAWPLNKGEYNSFYFSEEILSTETYKKKISVSDRATLFNLLIGLNGYTISSGVLNSDLNGEQIKAVRLNADDEKMIGYITNESVQLSGWQRPTS